MKKSKSKREPRSHPRDVIQDRGWYYVNYASVDLIVREPGVWTSTVRLTRKQLQRMLSDLRPFPALQAPRP